MRGLFCLVFLLGPVISPGEETGIAIPEDDSKRSAYIDDSRLLKLLQGKLEKAIQEKEPPDADQLRQQLARSRTAVSLDSRTGGSPMSPRQIYENRLASVLILGNLYQCDKCDKWHLGTAGAVILTKDGIAATNHHVIENPKAAAFGAMDRDGLFYPVIEVLAASDPDDVALIRLGGDHFVPAPLGEARTGEPVTVISHPDKSFFTLTTGVASRFARSRNRARRPVLEISADYARGSSGSPVFGPRGAVVGLVSRTRSIYYEREKGPAGNLQMVKKICVPSESIRALVKPRDPGSLRIE